MASLLRTLQVLRKTPQQRSRLSAVGVAFATPPSFFFARASAVAVTRRGFASCDRLRVKGTAFLGNALKSARMPCSHVTPCMEQPVSSGSQHHATTDHLDQAGSTPYGSVSRGDDADHASNGAFVDQRSNSSQDDASDITAPDSSRFDARWLLGGVVVAAIALVGVGAASGELSLESFLRLAEWFEKLGPGAIVVYSLLYFVLELLGVPATPLTLGCGYLFGVTSGAVAISISATCAAATSFLITRYGLRNFITKLAKRYPKFRAFDKAIGREGFKFVFLLRLSPLLPFALSNYLYGLTSVRFRDYVLGSWLGMLPGTIAYVSGGAAVSALTDISASKDNFNPALVVVGIAATVLALGTIGKLASSAVAESSELEDDAT